MTYTPSLEDTQPRPPYNPSQPDYPPQSEPIPPVEEISVGPGCLIWGVVGAVGLGFALMIVLLAGVAGWTSGQRVADTNATATRSADINDQLTRIPGDVASGNTVYLQARIEYLATLTPGVA